MAKKQDKTDKLIDALTQVATPVRPLASSKKQTCIWALSALAIITLMVLLHGFRYDIAAKSSEAIFLVKSLALVGLSFFIAYAGFKLGVPDSPQKHRLWVAAIYGALIFWASLLFYDAFHIGYEALLTEMQLAHTEYVGCFCAVLIISSSLGAAAVMFIMLRHSFPFRPLIASLGVGVAAASFAYVGSMYFCSIETTKHILVWHMLPVLAISLFLSILGTFFLKRL